MRSARWVFELSAERNVQGASREPEEACFYVGLCIEERRSGARRHAGNRLRHSGPADPGACRRLRGVPARSAVECPARHNRRGLYAGHGIHSARAARRLYDRKEESGTDEIWAYPSVSYSTSSRPVETSFWYRDRRGHLRHGSNWDWMDVRERHEREALRVVFRNGKVLAIEALRR